MPKKFAKYVKPSKSELVPNTVDMRDIYAKGFTKAFPNDDGRIILNDIAARDDEFFNRVYDSAARVAELEKQYTLNECIHRKGFLDGNVLNDQILVDGQDVLYNETASKLIFGQDFDTEKGSLSERLSAQLDHEIPKEPVAHSEYYYSNSDHTYENPNEYDIEEHEQYVKPQPQDTVVILPGQNGQPDETLILKSAEHFISGYTSEALEYSDGEPITDDYLNDIMNNGYNAFDTRMNVYTDINGVEHKPLDVQHMTKHDLEYAGRDAYQDDMERERQAALDALEANQEAEREQGLNEGDMSL